MGGQAAFFTPPTIHKSNLVIFPKYLAKNRLKSFAKSIGAKFTMNKEELVTVVNDSLELHYQIFNKHIQFIEISLNQMSLIDSQRCLEFLRYESYLLQKPIYCETLDQGLLNFLSGQGFRILRDFEETQEVSTSFWEKEKEPYLV